MLFLLACHTEPSGPVDVHDAAEVAAHPGERVVVHGNLEQVPLGDHQATALVLSDDTRVYLTYGDPPHGWEGLAHLSMTVEGTLGRQFVDEQGAPVPPQIDGAHLLDYDAPKPNL